MASFFGIAKPGAKGIDIRTHTVTLKAHAAITKGQVVAVSRTITDLSPEGTVVVFDTTAAPGTGADGVDDIKCGIFVCALENVASGAEGKFALSGIVDAEYDGTAPLSVTLSPRPLPASRWMWPLTARRSSLTPLRLAMTAM